MQNLHLGAIILLQVSQIFRKFATKSNDNLY